VRGEGAIWRKTEIRAPLKVTRSPSTSQRTMTPRRNDLGKITRVAGAIAVDSFLGRVAFEGCRFLSDIA
jgi:hypothetical protein